MSMPAAQPQTETTALRSLEMRSRMLTLGAQMTECVELLQCPDVVIDDLRSSILQARDEALNSSEFSIASTPESQREGFFYPYRELFVQGDGCSFTCLATEVEMVEAGAVPSQDEFRPVDYAAVTCESVPFPVLGFVQSADSESAYPLLLRAVSTLIEMTRPRRMEAIDGEIFRGLLGSPPLVDLALVLWDDDREEDPRRPLCELSRDLAEVLKCALKADKTFPPVLNDIVCLRMNPKRFDARLRFVWRV